jgi:hypothetical protein
MHLQLFRKYQDQHHLHNRHHRLLHMHFSFLGHLLRLVSLRSFLDQSPSIRACSRSSALLRSCYPDQARKTHLELCRCLLFGFQRQGRILICMKQGREHLDRQLVLLVLLILLLLSQEWLFLRYLSPVLQLILSFRSHLSLPPHLLLPWAHLLSLVLPLCFLPF